MSFTNYLEHKVLDHLFGAVTYTPTGTLFVGLSTTTPLEDGTNFTEPSTGSGYTRAGIVNTKSNWITAAQVSTSGSLHNLNTVSFPAATGNWGTVTHFGLFEGATSSSGNLICQSSLTQSKTIDAGDTASFASGALIIRID